MNIPSTNISGPASGSVYSGNNVSRKNKETSGTFAEQMEKAAEKKDRYVPDSSPNTSPSITDSLIRGWAKKYDPRNMTQAEYQAFLDDLVAAGVIEESDKLDLRYYPDIIVLDPDAPKSHEVVENDPFELYLNLAQAGGNALRWAEFWKNYYGGGIYYTSEFVRQQQALFDKVESVLGRMAEVE